MRLPWSRSVCAVHVHTSYSDGSAPVERIVADAHDAGIDVLMLTDHHTMAARRHGWAGWQGDVLVICGYEHSDPLDQNHLLVFGLDEPMDPTLTARDYVREAAKKGAVTFVAHPIERRGDGVGVKAYPWTASLSLPFHGIEVWNYMSLWVERLKERGALRSYLVPGASGERPDPDTLRLWEACATTRPVAGIAGLDAHAVRVSWGPLRVTLFPHARHFRGPLTVVETPAPLSRRDGKADTALVLRHLAKGNSYMGLQRWGRLREVEAVVDGSGGPVWGETFVLEARSELALTLPGKARVRLVSQGACLGEARGTHVRFPIARPGIYRVEAYRRGSLWILTNHVRFVPRDPSP